MTKEQIEARLKVLTDQREQARMNYMALEGAIQDCNYWLSEMDNSVSVTPSQEEPTS